MTFFSQLHTLYTLSYRHFQIAFKMFDLNGDGNVDADEFDKVTDLMKQHSSTGNKNKGRVCPQSRTSDILNKRQQFDTHVFFIRGETQGSWGQQQLQGDQFWT